MDNAFLGLGSNINNKSQNLINALKELSNHTKIVKISSVYRSQSLLKDHQEDYFNITIKIQLTHDPQNLLSLIKNIESKLGRIDVGFWRERLIDIDILDFNNKVLKFNNLSIPHPEMVKRTFVLYPLKEIEPEYIHPILQCNIDDIIKNINDDLNITKIGRLNWQL
ncbi:MAG: 2-amino-4-hydroxy-6-hydroxymethyldihydropteridine diphosphokinase [Deferribacterales bacterium]